MTLSIFAGLAQKEIKKVLEQSLHYKQKKSVGKLGKQENLGDTGMALDLATNKAKTQANINNIRAK